jgi:hypothetical protein
MNAGPLSIAIHAGVPTVRRSRPRNGASSRARLRDRQVERGTPANRQARRSLTQMSAQQRAVVGYFRAGSISAFGGPPGA